MNGTHSPYARLALVVGFFKVPREMQSGIAERWNMVGQPAFDQFAPYASFVLTIYVFFRVALAARLIATERSSNHNDIAYLYYLPFCNVFVSSDKLHRRTAGLFMRENQKFVWGPDLKAALGEANDHFLQLPEHEREQGITGFRHKLPEGNVIDRLWPRGVPKQPPCTPSGDTPELHAELLKRVDVMKSEPTLHPTDPAALEEPEALTVERKVRRKRGSWWQVPKDMPADT